MLHRLVCLLVCLSAIVIIGIAVDAAGKCDVIRIGYQVIPNTEAIAKAMGWHEERMHSINIQWLQFDSGRDVNTALAAGGIDIGQLGSTLIANGLSVGLNYKVIWLADVIGDNEALVVRPDCGIRSLADLKGKTIAVTFGSTTQYTFLGALEAYGIDASSIDIVDMQPPDMLAAWLRGDIDGGYVWHPTLGHMIDDGGVVLISSADLVDLGIITADVLVVSERFARDCPEVVKMYLESQVRAVELFRTDPQAAADAVAREFGITPEEARVMMDDLVWLSGSEQLSERYLGTSDSIGAFASVLEDTAAFLREQHLVDTTAPRETFVNAVDPAYLEDVMKELASANEPSEVR